MCTSMIVPTWTRIVLHSSHKVDESVHFVQSWRYGRLVIYNLPIIHLVLNSIDSIRQSMVTFDCTHTAVLMITIKNLLRYRLKFSLVYPLIMYGKPIKFDFGWSSKCQLKNASVQWLVVIISNSLIIVSWYLNYNYKYLTLCQIQYMNRVYKLLRTWTY